MTNSWIKEVKKRKEWKIFRPRVKITPEALADLLLYAKLCPTEISGYGEIKIEGKDLIITRVFILYQRSSEVFTELDEEAEADFLEQHFETIQNYRLWWHSHGSGKVGWSGIDLRTIFRDFSHADFWISIVVNRFGKYKAIIVFSNRPLKVIFGLEKKDRILLELTRSISKRAFRKLMIKRKKSIEKEIQEKVLWRILEKEKNLNFII